MDTATYPKPEFYQTPSEAAQWSMWNFAATIPGFFTLPHITQRTYAAKNLRSLKIGYMAILLGVFLLYIPASYVGTMTVQILADAGIENPTSPFGALLDEIIASGGVGLVVGHITFTAILVRVETICFPKGRSRTP